jgi:4-hydroxybenzoate polyprenyltransferase
VRAVRLSDVARIIADTAVYRVKKREAGNLVTSITLAIAIGLSARDVAHRLAFGVVLNLFVYLVNDCFDVDVDAHAEGRDRARSQFLAAHLAAGVASALLLAGLAAAIAGLHSRALLLVFAINVVVIVAYSRVLKRKPIVDLLCMAAWGASMALVGAPLDHPDALRLVALLALLCIVTEGVQVIRDVDSDRRASIRTTAVALGVPVTATITRLCAALAAIYATVAVHRYLGPLLFLAVVPRLDTEHASRTWDRLRLLFGATWLAIMAHLYWSGRQLPLSFCQ